MNAVLLTLLRFFAYTVILLRFLHPLNAPGPIFLTFFPITTDLSFLLFLKESAARYVTLTVLLSIFTVAGTVTLVLFFDFGAVRAASLVLVALNVQTEVITVSPF